VNYAKADKRIVDIQLSTALLCGLSVLLTVTAWATSRRPTVRWLTVLVGPFVIATGVYWLPVLLNEAPRSEYAHWAVIFIGIWGIGGVVTSALSAFVWTVVCRRVR
jgi:apolipoprotein N-acyltransferase